MLFYFQRWNWLSLRTKTELTKKTNSETCSSTKHVALKWTAWCFSELGNHAMQMTVTWWQKGHFQCFARQTWRSAPPRTRGLMRHLNALQPDVACSQDCSGCEVRSPLDKRRPRKARVLFKKATEGFCSLTSVSKYQCPLFTFPGLV